MRKRAKKGYGESAKAEQVSENVRGERLVFLFQQGDAEKEYYITSFLPHTYHTRICVVEKGVIVLFTL